MSTVAPRKRINLYSAEFRPPQRTLPTASLLLGVGIFTVGLVALYAWDRLSLDKYRQEADRAVQQAATLEAQLSQTVKAAYAPADPATLAEAQALEARTRSLQSAEAALADGSLGSSTGYGAHFLAVARATVPGAWLTQITVSGGGKAMTLAGQATAGDAPAKLIAALGRQPLLAGLHFAALEVSPPAPPQDTPDVIRDKPPAAPSDLLTFTLSATRETPPDPRSPKP